ncbi:Neurotrypsin [Holothuria leucospilota]|uniref:Neurotrypsin n=1 Tax=Holothuria leucospilota TaxID=206669 RepID=A0A9Q1H5G2_HOLLE|nr:Neurotrypsin [Holothuria leucospilota]
MAHCGCYYYFIAPLVLGMLLTAFVFSDGAKDLQLVGGSLPNEGRIELLFGGERNNICSNRATWTAAKSEVMCRQLGYAGHVTEKYDAHFGEGNWTTVNDPLNCTGGSVWVFYE